MKAEEEYVPEREEEEAEDVLGELEQDRTEAEQVEEEGAAQEADTAALEMVRRAAVVEVVRDMLAERTVEISRIEVLNDQEREALTFLQAVIEGRTETGGFIYAERRIEQLNLVLADLQPLLSVGLVEGLDTTLGEIVDGIQELRHKLELLEEAQEEVFRDPEKKKDGEEDDDDDKPDDGKPDDAKPEDAKPTSSLAAESTAAAAAGAEGAEGAEGEKKPGLWGRLWNRGKKPDEGGGGGGA